MISKSVRRKKNFKKFKRDLEQVVIKGTRTDGLQYVMEIDDSPSVLLITCCRSLVTLLRVIVQRVTKSVATWK